jgi:hypothetical protein
MKSLNGADSLVEVKVHTGGDLVWESSFIADPIGVRLLKVASDCASRGHSDDFRGEDENVPMLRRASDVESAGTFYIGDLHCSYWTLFKLFNNPHVLHATFPRASWEFMYADNWVFTIYDWAQDDIPLEDVTVWHVGGKDKAVLPVVRGLVAEFLGR